MAKRTLVILVATALGFAVGAAPAAAITRAKAVQVALAALKPQAAKSRASSSPHRRRSRRARR